MNNLESRLQTAKGQLATFSQELETRQPGHPCGGQNPKRRGQAGSRGREALLRGEHPERAVTAPLLAAGGAAIVMASDYSGLVWDASTGMWTELTTNNAEAAAEAADYLTSTARKWGRAWHRPLPTNTAWCMKMDAGWCKDR